MRKTVLSILVIMLMLALAACRVTVEKQFCPVVTETPANAEAMLPSDTSEPDIEAQDYIGIVISWNNGYYLSMPVPDERRGIVTDAVEDYRRKSAAWPGVDVESQDMYIQIYEESAEGKAAEYYVFEKDGQPCMQAGMDVTYSIISDEVYRPLYELAMGWYTLHTMTVASGGESIFAVSNDIWAESEGLSVDGIYLTSQQVQPMVEYVTYAEGFSLYIDGELQPGVRLKLYNEEYEEVEYPIPSGLAAWTYINHVEPGRYIAVAEMSFEEEDGSHSGYQYFFGLIVPESNK